MNTKEIVELAQQNGWTLRKNPDQYVLIFDCNGSQINVWYTKMTVGVFLRVKGWTDFKRGVYHRFVNKKKLKAIFKNTSKNGVRETTYKPTNKPFRLPSIDLSCFKDFLSLKNEVKKNL